MHLRYSQVVRIRVELDARECSKLVIEEHLHKTAVDITPACRYGRVLFHYEHLLLEHRVEAIA